MLDLVLAFAAGVGVAEDASRVFSPVVVTSWTVTVERDPSATSTFQVSTPPPGGAWHSDPKCLVGRAAGRPRREIVETLFNRDILIARIQDPNAFHPVRDLKKKTRIRLGPPPDIHKVGASHLQRNDINNGVHTDLACPVAEKTSDTVAAGLAGPDVEHLLFHSATVVLRDRWAEALSLASNAGLKPLGANSSRPHAAVGRDRCRRGGESGTLAP